MASVRAQKIALGRHFHAFGGHGQFQDLTDVDQRLRQRFCHFVATNALHKTFVDFQFLDGEPVEVAQGRVARAQQGNRIVPAEYRVFA